MVEFAGAVTADAGPRQFGKAERQVLVGAPRIHVPAGPVAVRRVAEHHAAELKGAVVGRVGVSARSAAKPAASTAPLLELRIGARCEGQGSEDGGGNGAHHEISLLPGDSR